MLYPQLKTDEFGFQSFPELPPDYEKCNSIKRFFKLRRPNLEWKKGNLELNYGLEYLVYSKYSSCYWYRKLNSHSNISKIFSYLKDGNVYVKKC